MTKIAYLYTKSKRWCGFDSCRRVSGYIKLSLAGPSLERVPRVPGTRDILSSYVMAPVNFSEISG